MELDAIAEPELDRIAKLGGADLVVGMLDPGHSGDSYPAVSMVREALAGLPNIKRAVVVCNNGVSHVSKPPEPVDDHSPLVVSCALTASGPAVTVQQGVFNAYRGVLSLGDKLGVRACVFVASRPEPVTHQWIYSLFHPVLELGFDLVAPRYTRHKMEGLLNRAVLSPLYRALYGQQLQNPMGPDFGFSGNLVRRILGHDPRRNPLASVASTAAAGGFQACESYLGARTRQSGDAANLSLLLAEVLGPVFLEMEKQAPYWQSVRGSIDVPEFGSPKALPVDPQPVDVRQMMESFHLGTQNLSDVWGLILPPTTLLELRKLSRLPAAQFRIPDDLWARIVYDFALGHRLQPMNRDHLLRSITSLYLGWIASYALELEAAGPAGIDSRVERLCRAFETNKSYLVSRWRWPDRFNP